MGNVIDYLIQYGEYGFKERPFDDVDNLILCQLSYLKFESFVPEIGKHRKNTKLMDIFTHPNRVRLYADERFEIPNRHLFEAVAFSHRFQNMGINYFSELINQEEQIQFAAMTFFLEDGPVYVAFRGTDETIVGWKEDFNMAFKAPVPSQILSVRYLNQAAKKINGSFMVGGHSKGGNLAVFSSMKCDKEIKPRILKIYTNDGPGFVEDIFSSDDFEEVKGRIIKLVPQSSVIGMLLQHQEEYQVIESSGKGGMGQHDPYTWIVEDGGFVHRHDLNQGRKLFNERLNEWVQSLDEQQRIVFVETLYQIVSVTEAETLIELTEEWKDNSVKMVNALKNIDPDTRKMLVQIVKAMFHIKKGNKKKLSKGKEI